MGELSIPTVRPHVQTATCRRVQINLLKRNPCSAAARYHSLFALPRVIIVPPMHTLIMYDQLDIRQTVGYVH